MYLTIIGDILRSRKLADRAGTQSNLEHALSALNRSLGDELASRFVVTLGDEFQGLLTSPAEAMDVLLDLERSMDFIPVRYGLGWGALSTELKEVAIGMDGPCFHHARAALDRGKKEKRWITVAGFGDGEDKILNGFLSLMAVVREGWTETQALTVSMARHSKMQKDVAKELGVVPSVVSESLSAASYSRFREADAALSMLMSRFAVSPEQANSSANKEK